jgi:nucleoside-diphosphate-sugar epimerase
LTFHAIFCILFSNEKKGKLLSLDNPKVLVVGATGLVGSEIVRQLISKGFNPRIFVRNKDKAIKVHNSNLDIYTGTIEDIDNLKQAMQGCDAVYNCVGEKSNETSFYATNKAGVKNIATAGKEAGIEFLCHVSSVSVAGKVNSNEVNEETECSPYSDYEKSKYQGELELRGIAIPKVVILRPTHVFSASTMHDFASISKARLLLKGGENANLVYVKDVAAAAVWLLQNADKIHTNQIETFIISSNHENGNTIGEVNKFINSGGADSSSKTIALPLICPYLLRKMRFGVTNWGNVSYNSEKLRSLGFELPYGWKNGVIDLLGETAGEHTASKKVT